MYGIYKEYIRNVYGISITFTILNNQKHRPMGRQPKAAPVFLIILYHKYLWIFLIYSYLFPIYFLYILHVFSLGCF